MYIDLGICQWIALCTYVYHCLFDKDPLGFTIDHSLSCPTAILSTELTNLQDFSQVKWVQFIAFSSYLHQEQLIIYRIVPYRSLACTAFDFLVAFRSETLTFWLTITQYVSFAFICLGKELGVKSIIYNWHQDGHAISDINFLSTNVCN